MDPITAAILAAAPALASDLVTSAVKDTYALVKETLRRKWGEGSSIEQAVAGVEANPGSKGTATVLEEEVTRAGAKNDADVMAAVAQLVEALKTAGIGGKEIANIRVSISGGTVQGVVGAHSVHVGSMSIGNGPRPPDPRKT